MQKSTTDDEMEENTDDKQCEKSYTNEELYSFTNNKFIEFRISTNIHAFCLHSNEPLIAISTNLHTSNSIFYPIMIYTLNGDLVTYFSFPNTVYSSGNIYISYDMLLTNHSHYGTTRVNDYNVKNIDSIGLNNCFCCDKDDHIYAYCSYTKPQIHIHTQDFDKIGYISIAQKRSSPMAMKIQDDSMVIMSTKYHKYSTRGNITILVYSISSKELMQTVKFNKHFFENDYHLSICLDPFSDVLIGRNFSMTDKEKIAVWHFGGRVRCYKCYDIPNNRNDQLNGLAMTKDFEIVRSTTKGYIRLYDPE
ncbi:hypothetical protein LOD99_11750 [Oopsacas minuta]|uniref:Uncharacterized protein n=1 Tax=Oopsacas minuta TaxID=111878 RepID=A0AAV7JLK3_9METZ|nr:hypothetical protein LOD99_11750 [Oopsacas minuta]